MILDIKINNQIFTLHQSGVVFWKAKKMLLISDVHMGKVAHFRRHGIAIPELAVYANIECLEKTTAFFKPEKIVFLGDLFHSKINSEWDLLAEWLLSVPVDIILVEGNHDIIDSKHYNRLCMQVVQFIEIDGFRFTHHPEEKEGFFNFCGHIHPGVKLYEVGRQAMQLACFFQKPNQMILPAFGEFTGRHYLKPSEDDKVYVITENEVIFIS
ncbi:MAG: ligase-associated DNA damage response endonuclease PdeM [Bacteroidota bacterium]